MLNICMYDTPPQCFILLTCSISFVIMYLQAKRQTVWILISWLLKKPADLDLHFFQKRIYQGSAGQGLSFIKPIVYSKIIVLCMNKFLSQMDHLKNPCFIITLCFTFISLPSRTPVNCVPLNSCAQKQEGHKHPG